MISSSILLLFVFSINFIEAKENFRAPAVVDMEGYSLGMSQEYDPELVRGVDLLTPVSKISSSSRAGNENKKMSSFYQTRTLRTLLIIFGLLTLPLLSWTLFLRTKSEEDEEVGFANVEVLDQFRKNTKTQSDESYKKAS